jgi:hypothetical protein
MARFLDRRRCSAVEDLPLMLWIRIYCVGSALPDISSAFTSVVTITMLSLRRVSTSPLSHPVNTRYQVHSGFILSRTLVRR